MSLPDVQALYKTAVERLDPESATPRPDPVVLRSYLCVHSILGHTRWLDAAVKIAEPLTTGPLPADRLGWLHACAEGWVQRASGPFRVAAARLAEHVEPSVEAVPTLLLYWRTTGRARWYDAALSAEPAEVTDLPSAAAVWGVYEATADEDRRSRVRAWMAEQDLGSLHPRWWSLAADVLELDAAPFSWESRDDPTECAWAVLGAAAVALPPLTLQFHWFIEQELREGPMAEAASYPWPTRRLRFQKLPHRDQLRMQPFVGDIEHELILDVGVIAEYIAHVVAEVDRSGLVGRARRRGRGLLGR